MLGLFINLLYPKLEFTNDVAVVKRGASVIISTHLISDIEKILDEVIFIDKGQIVLQSDADKLRNKEQASIDEIFRRMFKC